MQGVCCLLLLDNVVYRSDECTRLEKGIPLCGSDDNN